VSLSFVIPVDLTVQLVSACFDLLVHAQTLLFSQCSFGVLVQPISRGLLVFFVLGVRIMLQARASKIVFGAGFDATTDKSNLLFVRSFG
jgi:hypothetical protein